MRITFWDSENTYIYKEKHWYLSVKHMHICDSTVFNFCLCLESKPFLYVSVIYWQTLVEFPTPECSCSEYYKMLMLWQKLLLFCLYLFCTTALAAIYICHFQLSVFKKMMEELTGPLQGCDNWCYRCKLYETMIAINSHLWPLESCLFPVIHEATWHWPWPTLTSPFPSSNNNQNKASLADVCCITLSYYCMSKLFQQLE